LYICHSKGQQGVTAFRSDIWLSGEEISGCSKPDRNLVKAEIKDEVSPAPDKKRILAGNYRKQGNWGRAREENHHTNDPKLRPPKKQVKTTGLSAIANVSFTNPKLFLSKYHMTRLSDYGANSKGKERSINHRQK
jgi:hypothetical protein